MGAHGEGDAVKEGPFAEVDKYGVCGKHKRKEKIRIEGFKGKTPKKEGPDRTYQEAGALSGFFGGPEHIGLQRAELRKRKELAQV